jgi:Arc/MetJ-type ribon-helix-helix transcriptional regulator
MFTLIDGKIMKRQAVVLSVRVPLSLAKQVEEASKGGGYLNISDFLRDLLRETLKVGRFLDKTEGEKG